MRGQYQSAKAVQELRDLGLTTTQIGESFGVETGSVSRWLRDDRAPVWTQIASEGIKRRMGKTDERPEIMVVMVPPDSKDVVGTFLAALGIRTVTIGQISE